ncbi:MAG: GTP cyclohydrolase I FolE2 [Armatimonadota bacterium]|nr:MAG: GTP cyclohydrolase I FolE2 [Armatimonadota bacterium]
MESRQPLTDVAAARDERGVTIQRVGVKDVHLPAQIRRKEGGCDSVLARVELTAELPHQFRGTHMSRFLTALFKWSQRPIASSDIRAMLSEVRSALTAPSVHISIRFKYFILKRAPVSGAESFLDYDCEFNGALANDDYVFTLGVEAPITCLCPCSREISAHGAHNQRGMLRVRVRYAPDDMIWIEDLVQELERHGSAQIFPLLKREDEKHVTEQAYAHPKFVEDVVRDTVVALRADQRVTWFEVECESYESIHNHSVYAYQQEERR